MKLLFICFLSLFSASAAAAACGVQQLPKEQQTSSPSFIVGYAPDPANISVAEHFSVILEVCKKDGKPYMGTPIVDAHMPMHRHGMNYRPTIEKISDGIFRAVGFLFHMPGKWQFKFDIEDGGKSERVTLDYLLK